LTERKDYFKGDEPKEWNPELIQQHKSINNRILRVVDFWIDSILGGFIIEFVVYSNVSYSEVEQNFSKGPGGK